MRSKGHIRPSKRHCSDKKAPRARIVRLFWRRGLPVLLVLFCCCTPSHPSGEGLAPGSREAASDASAAQEKALLFEKIRNAVSAEKGGEAYALLSRLSSFSLSEGERREAKTLMKKARALLDYSAYCPGTCRWDKEWFQEGEEISFSVILENRTGSSISLFSEGAAGSPKLQIFFVYKEYDPLGQAYEMTWNRLIPVEGKSLLPPGTQWQQRVALSKEARRPFKPLYKRIRVWGEILFPSIVTLSLGEDEELGCNRLAFSPSETEIYPEGIESLISDAEGYLLRSLELVAREPLVLNNVFVAALFFSKADLHKCVNILLEKWEGQEQLMNRTCSAALSLITGVEGPRSRAEWLNWWKENAAAIPSKRALPRPLSERST